MIQWLPKLSIITMGYNFMRTKLTILLFYLATPIYMLASDETATTNYFAYYASELSKKIPADKAIELLSIFPTETILSHLPATTRQQIESEKSRCCCAATVYCPGLVARWHLQKCKTSCYEKCIQPICCFKLCSSTEEVK
jgi:hypothetical protein